MSSAFIHGCGYDNSNIILLGDMYCPNKNCSSKLCLHKKTFQSLGRSDYQSPQCASTCRVRNIPFEGQTNSFFLSFGQGAYNFEESPKSFQDNFGDVYCPGNYCSNREKCESNDGYAITPRSIFGFGTCGFWLLVHKAPFMLPEHVKRQKQTKHAFALLKKEVDIEQTFVIQCSIPINKI